MMKLILLAATIGLTSTPLGARAAQDRPAPVIVTPPAAPAPASAPGDVDAARAAVANADLGRVSTDRAYAEQYVQNLDRILAAANGDPRIEVAVDSLKLVALPILDRKDEARAAIDRLLGQRSRDVPFYVTPLYAAITIRDDARTVAVVETASQNVPGVEWAHLRQVLDRQTMGSLLFGLKIRNQVALRARLASALFRIGWPGPDELESSDILRNILIDDHLGRGDNAQAMAIAQGVATPDSVLTMIVLRKYDPILAPGQDRLGLLRAALVDRDRSSTEAISSATPSARQVLGRVQYLRSLGRNADALVLLQPFLRDVPATVSASEEGMWLVNEAAYALIALGRTDEALRVMRPLVALPVAGNGGLIGPDINFAAILWETGHPQDAIDYAARLERESGQFANDFGKLWLASATACSLASLHRTAEAAPQLERLRSGRDTNPAAATRAFLCVGDDEAAAALMIHRLESDDPGDAILALQDFTLSSGPSQTGEIFDRLVALRQRAEVRTALERVGRVLSLPLARTYWGGF